MNENKIRIKIIERDSRGSKSFFYTAMLAYSLVKGNIIFSQWMDR